MQPQRIVFLRRFGLKFGVDFAHLVWNQSLCLSSSLKMTTLFLPIPGLKTGVNLRQPALKKKGVEKKKTFCGLLRRQNVKRGSRFGEPGGTPPPGIPPGVGKIAAQECKKSTSG